MREPTVRQLFEAEQRQAIETRRDDFTRMLRETTLEDIEDFEHNIGLRNRRSHQRWHDREKDRLEEAERTGVKVVKAPRGSTALDFYDYSGAETSFQSLSPQQNYLQPARQDLSDTSPQSTVDHFFDPPVGSVEAAELRREITTPGAMPDGDMRKTLKRLGNDDGVQYLSFKEVAVATTSTRRRLRQSTAPARTQSTPWSSRTMLEPIFFPNRDLPPADNQEQLKRRPPFVTCRSASTLSEISSLGVPMTEEALVGSISGQNKPACSWEETIGRKYFERRLRDFQQYNKKLEQQQRHAEFNKNVLFAQMREKSLQKMEHERRVKAELARSRGEYFPQVKEIIQHQQSLIAREEAYLANERMLRLGMSSRQRREEAEETFEELRNFEEMISKGVVANDTSRPSSGNGSGLNPRDQKRAGSGKRPPIS